MVSHNFTTYPTIDLSLLPSIFKGQSIFCAEVTWSKPFSLQKYLLRYYSFQDKNDEINTSILENAGATASGKNLCLYMQYQWIIRRIQIPSRRISSVHGINISRSIRARLGANRRDKNGNIRRLGVAAARYPCDVNGFIISRRQRRTRWRRPASDVFSKRRRKIARRDR